MASTTVSFDIIAQDRASSKFDHLSRSVDHSGGALSKFSSIAKSAAKAGALAVGAGAVIAAKGLYEAAQAAVEDEAAAAKLATTLKTVANATDGQISSVERWISAQGKALGVTDDDLRPSLQRLVEATHDVGKAQDLASLAMDVSAAKGKPLVQVSEALMKAYNGNIGALGRLGIKTKDAAGETISFDEATKEMADTFGGAASAHADTLAGKMEVLKVQISEAGESIGYKLLPYVSDAATWLGDHLPAALDATEKKAGPVFAAIVDGAEDAVDAVKPAAKEIIEALDHMTDGGAGLDHIWGDVLLPTLETAADVIGDVVNFVDELPGPVKEFGAEAAIAAIALSKLNTGIKTIKESNFVSVMADGERRMAGFAAAARNAAGVAGMVALADSTQQTNDKVKVLERTIGGALTGFSLGGGPIGAAIGGVAGLATSFGDLQDIWSGVLGVEDDAAEQTRILAEQQNAAADAAIRHKDAVDSLRAALDGGKTSAASLEPAYANVVSQLNAGGVSAATADRQWRLLGISQRTVAQASLGNEEAIKKLNHAYAHAPLKNRIINEHTLADAMDNSRVANREAIKAERDHMRLTQEWAGKLKKFPKNAATAIRLEGVQPTLRGVAKVAEKYKNLDKQDIKTILEVTGVDATVADVRKAQGELDKTDKKNPKPKVELSGLPLFNQQMTSASNQLVALDGDRADTYIYTHHVDTYSRGGGGGGAGGSDGDPSTPGRMMAGGPTHSTFSGPTTSASRSRRPIHVTVRLGNREFRDFVAEVANDQIEQDREFARIQGD